MQHGQFLSQGSDLVLGMCVKMGADLYIFGSGGRDYSQEDDFAEAGIGLCFQDDIHPECQQQHAEFKSGLSIVDLLFDCGDDSLAVLMEGNRQKAGEEKGRHEFVYVDL